MTTLSASYLPIWTNGTPGTEVVTDPKYGAYGDGVHDDAAAIQAALNAGPVAFLPNGTYNVTSLNIPANTWLVGQNPIASILQATDGTVPTVVFTGDNAGIMGVGFATASGVTPQHSHVHTNGQHAVTLQRLRFALAGNGGIYAYSGQDTQISDIEIRGTTAANPGVYAYGVDMLSISGVRSHGLQMTAGRPAVIRVSGSARVALSHCVIRDTSATATMTQGTATVDIMGGNDITCTGIVTSSSTSAAGAGAIDGFSVENASSQVVLDGCIANGHSGDGFDIYNAQHVTLNGCAAQGNTSFGAEIFDPTSDVSLVGCDLSNNKSSGMTLSGVPRIVVDGCRIAMNQSDGITVLQSPTPTQSTDIVITGGQIYNNNQSKGSYVGISLADATARVTIANNEIFDDQATPTQTYAVQTANSATAHIRSNTFYGNASGAVDDVVGNSGKTGNAGYNDVQTTVTGTSAGSFVASEPVQETTYKKVVVWLDGYENDTTTGQSYTFPMEFTETPAVTTNSASVPGVTVSTTTLSLAPDTTTKYTGWIVVEGY